MPVYYIYVAIETDQYGNSIYPDIIKIGYTDNLQRRFQQFRREQWCINPRIIRVFRVNCIHPQPDKIIHRLLDNFMNGVVVRIDPNKEFYRVVDFNRLDELFNLLAYEEGNEYFIDGESIRGLINQNNQQEYDVVTQVLNQTINNVVNNQEDDQVSRLRTIINNAFPGSGRDQNNIAGYIRQSNIERVLEVINSPGFIDLFDNIENNILTISHILKESLNNLNSSNRDQQFVKATIRLLIDYIQKDS